MIAFGSTETGTPGRLDSAGVYLTDEVFLYRLAGVTAEGMVELEDCYWLDVVRVPASDVRARELRVVVPEPG
jgi:hypothetical protein